MNTRVHELSQCHFSLISIHTMDSDDSVSSSQDSIIHANDDEDVVSHNEDDDLSALKQSLDASVSSHAWTQWGIVALVVGMLVLSAMFLLSYRQPSSLGEMTFWQWLQYQFSASQYQATGTNGQSSSSS